MARQVPVELALLGVRQQPVHVGLSVLLGGAHRHTAPFGREFRRRCTHLKNWMRFSKAVVRRTSGTFGRVGSRHEANVCVPLLPLKTNPTCGDVESTLR